MRGTGFVRIEFFYWKVFTWGRAKGTGVRIRWFQKDLMGVCDCKGWLDRHFLLQWLTSLFMFSWLPIKFFVFFAFSAMGAAFLELLQTYHAESASQDVLQVSKLEADAKSLGHLPMSALDFITFHVLASLLCILIANVMQDTPGIIPHLADHVLQLVSTCTVGVSTFCLCVMLLFFLIGALLNPSSALKPLLIVGSCGAVVATMWMQFSNLTRGLLKVRPDSFEIFRDGWIVLVEHMHQWSHFLIVLLVLKDVKEATVVPLLVWVGWGWCKFHVLDYCMR